MSHNALADLPSTSVDVDRLGIITSTPFDAVSDEPGRGSVYSMGSLAAGRLFHCHRAGDAFLLSYATNWTAATPAAAVPGAFSAKTIYARPTFWWVNPGAGGSMVGATSGYGTVVGQLYPQGDAALRICSAVSIGDMLVYLGSHKGGQFLATYRVDKGVTQFVGTRWLTPLLHSVTQAQVSWDRGVFGHGTNLYMVGSRPDNVLFLAKATMRSTGLKWLSDTGWTNTENATPLLTTDGEPMTSEGNVSVVTYRGQWIASTVVGVGTNWEARFWRAKHPISGFEPIASPTVNLGPKTQSAMLVGAFLQQNAHPNFAHTALAGVSGGVPYTYTVESATALRTSWGLLGVPQARL